MDKTLQTRMKGNSLNHIKGIYKKTTVSIILNVEKLNASALIVRSKTVMHASYFY